MYLWTWVWPVLIVRPLFISAPSGILSATPPYTPGMETVPPLRQQMNRLTQRVRALGFHVEVGFDLVVHVLDRAIAVRFHADGVDADVGTDAAGEVEQAFVNIFIVHVDRDGAGVAGHFHAFGHTFAIIDGDDLSRRQGGWHCGS